MYPLGPVGICWYGYVGGGFCRTDGSRYDIVVVRFGSLGFAHKGFRMSVSFSALVVSVFR